ncbi:SpoIID/LytB domain-containing protein [Paenibacillus oralis]|nr:SpoIID/LytB domain-containing protein [Paenibacillus oralis]
MFKFMGKWIGILAILSMIFTVPLASAAASDEQLDSFASDSTQANIPTVVQKYMEAINTKDWKAFVDSYSPDIQKSYSTFPSKDQLENRTGILSVNSIEVYEVKELPAIHIMEIEPYFKEINTTLYDNVHYYYIGFNYNVSQESEFFYNGVRYELVATGNLDGTEYIIGHENVYDLTSLDKYGYTFKSDAVTKAQNIVDQREKGIIVNFNNEVLPSSENTDDTMKNTEEVEKTSSLDESSAIENEKNENTRDPLELQLERASLEKASKGNSAETIQPFSATSTPSTIKLYITKSGTLKNIGFDSYAKQVLPNEWYASWNKKALQAGAITIKTYAWYNATYPRKPATNYGAHLTDNPDNYQHFVENSNETSTDNAVNDVSGIFMRNSNGKVFDAQYRAGKKGEIGEAFGGVLSQWGTQYIATNYPEYDYYTILSYYYSFSDKSDDYIQVGKY